MSSPPSTSRSGGGSAPGTPPESTDPALAKLEAHFRTLDDTSLTRVAHAVELARATADGESTDNQILDALRPRLKIIRPHRISTLQRAVCMVLEPFLFSGPPMEEKRKGAIPRAVLQPWWTLVVREVPELATLSNRYGDLMKRGKADDSNALAAEASTLAGPATLKIVAQAESNAAKRGAALSLLGSDRTFPDLREIAELVQAREHLLPGFERLKLAAPALVDGRIADFTMPTVLAARIAYTNIHGAAPALLEYFIIGLLNLLIQPWQALRLVRLLSTDMSKAADGFLDFIPSRLFSDLTRTLTEIGKSVGTEGGMSRRVWLMTCARLLQDAGAMIRGLAEESQQPGSPPEWKNVLNDARQRVLAASDSFAGAAVLHMLMVMPERKERGDRDNDVRTVPNMTAIPDEESRATAMAASQLFLTARKLAEQEGNDRAFRGKETDLIHRMTIGINFRIEFLRARGRSPAAVAQLDAVHKVLQTLPRSEAFMDLAYKAERMIERFK